ncbi:hypothetical protein OIU78_009574, partial [Salix suchowensis]
MVPSRKIQYSGPPRAPLRSRISSWFKDIGARELTESNFFEPQSSTSGVTYDPSPSLPFMGLWSSELSQDMKYNFSEHSPDLKGIQSLLENNPDAGDRVCPIFDHSSARVFASYVADQHVCPQGNWANNSDGTKDEALQLLGELSDRLGVWAMPVYVGIHTIALALCLPCAVFFEAGASLLFGFLPAVLCVFSAKVLGASLSFWVG